MISKISMKDVASYKDETILETDKKVNLLYGLNGSGKSTISNYLYDMTNESYSNCSVEGLCGEEILVYNQSFIADNFYEVDTINGVFTLSQENKEAQQKLEVLTNELKEVQQVLISKNDENNKLKVDFKKKKEDLEKEIWKIKGLYSGGDRILEYCLEGYKSNKGKLFDYLCGIKLKEEPQRKIEAIKMEVESLKSSDSKPVLLISDVRIQHENIESNSIFKKIIVGNEESTLSDLINKLSNSDWVKEGLMFLQEDSEVCPFCQKDTITTELRENIAGFFSKQYEIDTGSISLLQQEYIKKVDAIKNFQIPNDNIFAKQKEHEIKITISSILEIMNENLNLINEKSRNPSKVINLSSTSDAINELNDLLSDINSKAEIYNKKLEMREETLRDSKAEFWNLMRKEYAPYVDEFKKQLDDFNNRSKRIDEEIVKLNKTVIRKKEDIAETQKSTINILEAVNNINNGLLELGIDDFCIAKASDNEADYFYKIIRTNNDDNIFKSLSEGEKMIISFLYFRELCKGKKSINSVVTKKIIAIDDPISSLSHIFIFNIGQMIKHDFSILQILNKYFFLLIVCIFSMR